jgi:hypothetical protein
MRKKLTLLAITTTLSLAGVLGAAGQAQAGNYCSSVLLGSGGTCIHGAGHSMATWFTWTEGSAWHCTNLRGSSSQSSAFLTYTVCASPSDVAFSGWDKVGMWGHPSVYNWSTFTSRFGGYFTQCSNSDIC